MINNCRICFEEDIRNNLISPCLCSGDIKYVHRNCLNYWRNNPSLNNKNFFSCEICKEEFILEINEELINEEKIDNLNFKYKLYIGIEILSIVLILLTTIFFIGKLVNNIFTTTKLTISNNQIINEFACGLIVLLVLFTIIGYITIIHSNGIRVQNGININNYSLDIKLFILIIGIILVLIIIYLIITHFINKRKEYFLTKKTFNINKYIVRDRDRDK